MRALLLVCFLSCAFISSSQSERDLINQIDSINSLALLHFNNNQIVESFNAFNESKKLSELINDSYGKAISSLHLGNIYKLMQEYDKAEGSYNAMLKAAKEINDNFLFANAFLNLGELKKTQNK